MYPQEQNSALTIEQIDEALHINESIIDKIRSDAKRVIDLRGGVNFRELGGYPSKDGRCIKWGKLFRSGTHFSLHAEDSKRLSTLDIHSLFDLRSTEERTNEPTDLQKFMNLGSVMPNHIVWDYVLNFDIKGKLSDPLLTLYEMYSVLDGIYIDFYENLPQEFGPRLSVIFDALLRGENILFHCSAGKDRTGFIAFIILSLLEIDNEIIFEDYLLTNQMLAIDEITQTNTQDTETDLTLNTMITKTTAATNTTMSNHFQHLPAEIRVQLAKVKLKYLHAAINVINHNYGSLKDYLFYFTGIDHNAIETIKHNYLSDI